MLLTKSWAAEYGPQGVRVNAVSPGPTRTEGTSGMGDGLDQLAATAPAGRPGTAEEIAEAIAFLATDRRASCTARSCPSTVDESPSEPGPAQRCGLLHGSPAGQAAVGPSTMPGRGIGLLNSRQHHPGRRAEQHRQQRRQSPNATTSATSANPACATATRWLTDTPIPR